METETMRNEKMESGNFHVLAVECVDIMRGNTQVGEGGSLVVR